MSDQTPRQPGVEGPSVDFEEEIVGGTAPRSSEPIRSVIEKPEDSSVLERPPIPIDDELGRDIALEHRNTEAQPIPPTREIVPGLGRAAEEAERALEEEIAKTHLSRTVSPTAALQEALVAAVRVPQESLPAKKPVVVPTLDTGEEGPPVVEASNAPVEPEIDEVFDREEAELNEIVNEIEAPFVRDEDAEAAEDTTPVTIAEEESESGSELETQPEVDGFRSAQVTQIRRASSNKDLKVLQRLDTKVDDIARSLFSMEKSQEFEREFIMKARNNILNTPRAVRIPNILSASVAEITAYSTVDILNVNRSAGGVDYVQKKREIFKSLFDRLIFHSANQAGSVLDFETWLSITKLADVDTYFFGALDATFPGKFSPAIRCSKCGHRFPHTLQNEELYFRTDARLTEDDLKAVLRDPNSNRFKEHPVYKESLLTVRRKLPTTGIYVEHGIPSLKDYLETLAAIDELKLTTNLENIDNPEADDFTFLITFLFAKRIAIPITKKEPNKVTGEEEVKVRYYKTDDRAMIAYTLSQLGHEDFQSLLQGPEVRKLMRIKPVRYSIRNVTCQNDECKAKIGEIKLSMEEFFFLRIGEAAAKIKNL